MRTLTALLVLGLIGPAAPAAEGKLSRAAWWLAQDGVKPLADLVNTAQPGQPPRFQDQVGKFAVTTRDRALEITGQFPEATVWRFDLSTFDGQFDMRKLYVPLGNCAFPDPRSSGTRRLAKLLGDPRKALTHTGPWEIVGGRWLVPTARVALDGKHVYTSWFDNPSLADQEAGRVYASFALDIPTPGKHTIRVSFDDFAYNTRWRQPRWRGEKKPPIEYGKNDLRPHHIGSIAVGIDERVAALEKVSLLPELKGKHPRLSYPGQPRAPAGKKLTIRDVEPMLVHVDTERGKLWEYCVDAESMASENDMDAGKNGLRAAQNYDLHVAHLSPEARKEWDRLYLKRFHGLYTFFVFQRNYHPTGYAQNHSSATVIGLLAAALAWDGPEADKWLRWGIMTCRKRIELYGRDGGLEWLNEARDYGLGYFQGPLEIIRHGTGLDLTRDVAFFKNEWRYALHRAPAFPTDASRKPELITLQGGMRTRTNPNVPLPAGVTPAGTPTNFHFDDVDQVYMRSGWGKNDWRARLWAGSVFGKKGGATAKRYNWAHCQVNQGSFTLHRGRDELILEPGEHRTYRKSAGNNNCILVNDTDQWGGGQVWHPRLEPDQVSRIAFFADGRLLSAARADLRNAYPPEAKVQALSRCLVHLKPDHFLVFDRVLTQGKGKAEWRFHTAFVNALGAPGRFAAFGYTRKRPGKGRSYDDHFAINTDIRGEVAFLWPGVKAGPAMSDVYYRYSPFSMPLRHLKVVQEGEGPLTLLTAFAPRLALAGKGNAFTGKSGDLSWAVLVGKGRAGELSATAHLAVAAHDARTGRTEVMRFGDGTLTYGGTVVQAKAEDLFAVIEKGRVTRLGKALE